MNFSKNLKKPSVYLLYNWENNSVYIGSCFMKPKRRFKQHLLYKNKYNKNGLKRDLASSYEIMNTNTACMEILYQFDTKVSVETLRKKEQYFIDDFKKHKDLKVLNKARAYCSDKNHYHSEYYFKNKDNFKKKEWYHKKQRCVCGSLIVWRHRNVHFKTKKHMNFIDKV